MTSADRRELKRVMDAAEAQDSRRRIQIDNQVESINRLMKDPVAAKEVAKLHELLAFEVDKVARVRMLIDAAGNGFGSVLTVAQVKEALDAGREG